MKIIERNGDTFIRHWGRWYKAINTSEFIKININRKTTRVYKP